MSRRSRRSARRSGRADEHVRDAGDACYAESGDLSIVYQVLGDGPFDVVYVSGFVSHQELAWELPLIEMNRRIARYARLITFDKRGTGLSERTLGFGSAEERMDDIRAVMDAVGSERAALVGISEGGPLAVPLRGHLPRTHERAGAVGDVHAWLTRPRLPDRVPSGGDLSPDRRGRRAVGAGDCAARLHRRLARRRGHTSFARALRAQCRNPEAGRRDPAAQRRDRRSQRLAGRQRADARDPPEWRSDRAARGGPVRRRAHPRAGSSSSRATFTSAARPAARTHPSI